MRILNRLVIVLSLTLVFLAGHVTDAAAQNYCTAANPSDSNDDYSALQTCLNGGGEIRLSTSGTYLISQSLTLSSSTTLTSTGGGRATIRAMANIDGRLLNASGSSYTIANIKFVGGRSNGEDAGDLPWEGSYEASCGNHGQNVYATGSGILIDNVESTEATCGSAFVISASNFEIRNSYFHTNGREEGYSPNSWADGLTVHACNSCWIHDNTFEDNTDIGLVVGGGSGGTIEDNTISNFNLHAFAGLHVGWFPDGDGDHAGITYDSNTIYSDEDMMSFGLIAGFEPWFNGLVSSAHGFVSDAGSITNNEIEGAVVNLAIEGIADGYVSGNTMYNNRGDWGFGCSSISEQYTAHYFGQASIQNGWSPKWFFRGGCGEWDTNVPWIDDDGALQRDTELEVNVPLYSDNGAYYLILQSDGNLVLYDQYHSPEWATGTSTGVEALMQLDGNFVLYSSSAALFHTGTDVNEGAYLVVQNDGNLVVYSLSGDVLWSLF